MNTRRSSAVLWSISVFAVLAMSAHGAAAEAPAKIISGPTASGSGDKRTVTFVVSGVSDVTVRIVDAKGETVRHLVSGMVGMKTAVAPLTPGSIEQKITWDGKDDAGKDVPPGCSVKVSVGMRAKFDKFIVWEKDACARSRSNNTFMAANDQCYVNQSSGVHLDTLRLFDAEGKRIRQVWPPNLDRPAEALKAFIKGRWGATDWDGDAVPFKVCHNSWYIFGVRSGDLARTTDGYVVGRFTGVGGGVYALDPHDLPHAWRWEPTWYIRQQNYKTRMRLAAGDDGDFYVTDDFHHIVGRFRAKDMSPIESFTHNGPQKLDKPSCFIGEKGKPGDDEGHFTGPEDVALDADGNICVLDGEKTKVYSKIGEFIRQAGKDAFPAPKAVPDAVKADEKNDRALSFPQFLMARDDGTIFLMDHGRERPILQMDADGKDVKPFKMPYGHNPYHGYTAFDKAGNWYAVISGGRKPQRVWKWDREGKRAKFGDLDEIVIEHEGDPLILSKGIAVAGNGDIYVVVQANKWTQKAPDMTGGVRFGDLSARGEKACMTRIDVYGPDGAYKKKGIVQSVGINDVTLDREGNIYVIDGTMWHGAQMGQVASGKAPYGIKAWPFPYLTPEQAALDPKTEGNKRYSLLSRLVKFKPEGGILDDPEGSRQLWDYAGVSGVSPWNCDAECPSAQICMDPDERVWVPDSFMYCIKAIDKAGNLIARIGKYGNEDCLGGGGDKRHLQLPTVVIDPEIPLSYPKGIAVYKDYLLISDMFAHRVMRCKLTFMDVKEAAIN